MARVNRASIAATALVALMLVAAPAALAQKGCSVPDACALATSFTDRAWLSGSTASVVDSPAACCQSCQDDPGCVVFDYNSDSGACARADYTSECTAT